MNLNFENTSHSTNHFAPESVADGTKKFASESDNVAPMPKSAFFENIAMEELNFQAKPCEHLICCVHNPFKLKRTTAMIIYHYFCPDNVSKFLYKMQLKTISASRSEKINNLLVILLFYNL